MAPLAFNVRTEAGNNFPSSFCDLDNIKDSGLDNVDFTATTILGSFADTKTYPGIDENCPPRDGRSDPFVHLGDVEINLILSYLTETDLEILRRVSRTWKGYSEHFNTHFAIRCRFPWADKATYETGGIRLANLQFRRHLYHLENMRRGTATRVINMDGVVGWHLKNSSLAWIDENWHLMIYDLRSESNGPTDCSRSGVDIPLFKVPSLPFADIPNPVVENVVQLRDWNILLCIREAGQLQWSTRILPVTRRTNFTVGLEGIYSLELIVQEKSTAVCLIKRSLKDGRIMLATSVRPWNGQLGQPNSWRISMTRDCNWITCLKGIEGHGVCTVVICTATAHLVRRIGDLGIWEPVHFLENQLVDELWEIACRPRCWRLSNGRELVTEWICFKSVYDREANAFYRQQMTLPIRTDSWLWNGIDLARGFLFSTFCPTGNASPTGSGERLMIKPLHVDHLNKASSSRRGNDVDLASAKPVTLPCTAHFTRKRSMGVYGPYYGPRQMLTFPASSWAGRRFSPEDHGTLMVGDYLVRCRPNQRSLSIIDFWPPW